MTEEPIIDYSARAIAADIVCAYVSHNAVSIADLPKLVGDMFVAVSGLGAQEAAPAPLKLVPAVSVRKSITPDTIICLHCALKFKSLKRHLMTHHSQTPEQYREMFGLKPDYPMTSTNYSAVRSGLAKQSGLGKKLPAKGKR